MAEVKMGTLADKAYKLSQELAAAEAELRKTAEFKKVAKLRDKVKEMEETIVKRCLEEKGTSFKGKVGQIGIIESEVPQVKDWNKVYEYILKNKSFELLRRALSTTGYRELIDSGKKVPGVETYTVRKPSIKKV